MLVDFWFSSFPSYTFLVCPCFRPPSFTRNGDFRFEAGHSTRVFEGPRRLCLPEEEVLVETTGSCRDRGPTAIGLFWARGPPSPPPDRKSFWFDLAVLTFTGCNEKESVFSICLRTKRIEHSDRRFAVNACPLDGDSFFHLGAGERERRSRGPRPSPATHPWVRVQPELTERFAFVSVSRGLRDTSSFPSYHHRL